MPRPALVSSRCIGTVFGAHPRKKITLPPYKWNMKYNIIWKWNNLTDTQFVPYWSENGKLCEAVDNSTVAGKNPKLNTRIRRDVYPNQGCRAKEREETKCLCVWEELKSDSKKEKVAVKLLLPHELQVTREQVHHCVSPGETITAWLWLFHWCSARGYRRTKCSLGNGTTIVNIHQSSYLALYQLRSESVYTRHMSL